MSWLIANLGLVLDLTWEHVRLSAIPIVLGFLLSVPIGWFCNRNRVARSVVLVVMSALFTIPSLALFVAMPLILGTKILDEINVVVALTIYAVAIMVRGAVDAFASVDRDTIQSATAMGYSRWSRFWTVEFPLAGPVLLANLRVVSVSTVSLVSVAALIGKGGLGYLFVNGKQRDFPEEVFIGIVAILILAFVYDALLVLLGRTLMPWSRLKVAKGPASTDAALAVQKVAP